MQINKNFFLSLATRADSGNVLKRLFDRVPNMPDNLYFEAGGPIRDIVKAAFDLTCYSLVLPTENNFCLNTVAVHIEDYLASHKQGNRWITGGDPNYLVLNKVADYLGNLQQNGTTDISPSEVMTVFIRNIRADSQLAAVFPVNATGVLHGNGKETLVAQTLGLSHILNAMVSSIDPKTDYPELYNLSADRYSSHAMNRICAIVLMAISLWVFIQMVPLTSVVCFAMKACFSAFRAIAKLLAWALLPDIKHVKNIAAVINLRERIRAAIKPGNMKALLPALMNQKGIITKCKMGTKTSTKSSTKMVNITSPKTGTNSKEVPNKTDNKTDNITDNITDKKGTNNKVDTENKTDNKASNKTSNKTSNKASNRKETDPDHEGRNNNKMAKDTKQEPCYKLRMKECKLSSHCKWIVNQGCKKAL